MTASVGSDLIAAAAAHRGEPTAEPGRRRQSLYRIEMLLRRVLGGAGVVLAVLSVTFVVTRVLAPDPVNLFLGQSGNGFVNAEAEALEKEKVRQALGLDTSLPHQFGTFLNHLAHGDLGQSFQTGRPVSAELASRLPATLEMAVCALILGVALGVLGGVVAAVRRDGIVDRIGRFLAVGGMALPQFWIGLMLLWIFSTTLHWAPGPIGRLPTGMAPPKHITGFYVLDGLLTGQLAVAGAAFAQLALPVITLAVGLGAPLFKVVRTAMLEAVSADYVRTAKALGFGARKVYTSYALKNALLPVVTVLAGIVAYTICGSVLVEGVFGWPGVGNYALQAIQTSDFPAVQGFVLFSALLYVVVYELLEFAYGIIDPRVRS